MALQGSGQISIAEIRDACTTCDNNNTISVTTTVISISRTVVTSTPTTSDLAGLTTLVNTKDSSMDTSTPYGMNEFYSKLTSSRIKYNNSQGTGTFSSTAIIGGISYSKSNTSTTYYDIPLGNTEISLQRISYTGIGGNAGLQCV
jgi:hypothetical protein